jgi:hypothetical protein
VFCSCLGPVVERKIDLFRHRMEVSLLRERAINEAMRVLEPGGVVVFQNFTLEDMRMAEHLGFNIKQTTVDASFPKRVICSFVGEKPDYL